MKGCYCRHNSAFLYSVGGRGPVKTAEVEEAEEEEGQPLHAMPSNRNERDVRVSRRMEGCAQTLCCGLAEER